MVAFRFWVFYVPGLPIEQAKCIIILDDATSLSSMSGVDGSTTINYFGDANPVSWRVEKTGYATQTGSPVPVLPEEITVYLGEGTLLINSNPEAKVGQISYDGGTYPFTTPSQVSLPFGTEVLVSMPADGFVEWEDGSTDPQRTLIINVGTQIITADYVGAGLPLLRIFSYDQNMDSFPTVQGVKLIYKGIEQYVNLPFASRVGTGIYTLVAEEAGGRSLEFWKLPDGTTSTEKYITIDVQTDTTAETHWITSGGWGWMLWLIPVGIVGGLILTCYLISKR